MEINFVKCVTLFHITNQLIIFLLNLNFTIHVENLG